MNAEEIASLSDRTLQNHKQVIRTCFEYHRKYTAQANKALVIHYRKSLELINQELLKRKHH